MYMLPSVLTVNYNSFSLFQGYLRRRTMNTFNQELGYLSSEYLYTFYYFNAALLSVLFKAFTCISICTKFSIV